MKPTTTQITVGLLTALSALGGACAAFFDKHTFEFHLEPNRPNVSRVWDEDEEIPEEVAEGF